MNDHSSIEAFAREVSPASPVICFSHLRWDFVLQRPQHLMSRFAKTHRVIFWQEPEAGPEGARASLRVETCAASGVIVVAPVLPPDLAGDDQIPVLRALLDDFLAGDAGPLVRWYYTPM